MTIDAIADKSGLMRAGWQKTFPDDSTPYTSAIVFLVRKGNPKNIHDREDLTRNGVEVISPHPKTSGGACWNYLAAWTWALKRELGDLNRLHDPAGKEDVAKAQKAAEKAAHAYLEHLYSPQGQQLVARHYYRPINNEGVDPTLLEQFSAMDLYNINDVFGGWSEAQRTHFANGGVFDRITVPGA